ncbi:MAG: hypothetical protein QOF90_3335 [Acetobacteraceae bacterium]|jgi:hypothetical protein|nr:hypothetical protein [Acetobacteraceae bacterium]MEA2788914.1 hypothetical protein [Acetobacteraceae bacterium]
MNRFHDEAREAKIMLGKAGTVARVATVAVISESDEHPGAWVVGSLDSHGPLLVYAAVFAGPEARARAVEYAAAKYSGLKIQ